MSRREAVTIREVAEAAGVAPSSVSRAFSRPHMLSPETVQRIRDAAERLGYVPNPLARGLSTGRYGNLAMIVPDVANPFFPPMIRAAQDAADAHDLCVFLGNSNEDPEKEGRLADRFIGQVEGLVLASPRMPEGRIRAVAAMRPVVLINRDVEGVPRVLIDSGGGIREAVERLVALGHRRIAYLGGPTSSWSNVSRLRALRSAAGRQGAEASVIDIGIASFEAGRTAASAVVHSGAAAVIAFDDLTAHGLMDGLAEAGVGVPDDIAVIGCDNVLGGRTSPTLSSISSPAGEAGRIAVELLRDALGSGQRADRRIILDTRLVVRASSG